MFRGPLPPQLGGKGYHKKPNEGHYKNRNTVATSVEEIFPEENLPKTLVRTQGALLCDLGDDDGGGDGVVLCLARQAGRLFLFGVGEGVGFFFWGAPGDFCGREDTCDR